MFHNTNYSFKIIIGFDSKGILLIYFYPYNNIQYSLKKKKYL